MAKTITSENLNKYRHKHLRSFLPQRCRLEESRDICSTFSLLRFGLNKEIKHLKRVIRDSDRDSLQ